METQTLTVRFDGATVAEGNRYAEDLRRELVEAADDVQVDRRRDDPEAQDFGATLVLVLGTPAIVAVAKAVHDWLSRDNAAAVTIERADGEKLVVRNLESKDVPATVAAFMKATPRGGRK
jgi:hypothetical protein